MSLSSWSPVRLSERRLILFGYWLDRTKNSLGPNQPPSNPLTSAFIVCDELICELYGLETIVERSDILVGSDLEPVVFDIDSVGLLTMYSDMNRGMPLSPENNGEVVADLGLTWPPLTDARTDQRRESNFAAGQAVGRLPTAHAVTVRPLRLASQVRPTR